MSRLGTYLPPRGPMTFLLVIASMVLLMIGTGVVPLSATGDKTNKGEFETAIVKHSRQASSIASTLNTNGSNAPLSRFEGFNNATGDSHFIVPNIIHYVRLNKTEFSFVDFLCLRAAYRNHRPMAFYIHTDVGHLFHGKYWEWIQRDPDLKERIRLVPAVLPSDIFGQPLSKGWRFFHGSDILRLRIMMTYGGIYLDNDVYVVKNLDKYRSFEIAINWDDKQFLGSQVIIAHKDARFLRLWLESYRDHYEPKKWYYNAGERPTVEILYQRPELVHRVKDLFGAKVGTSMKLYRIENYDWRQHDAIHLLMNHRYYLDKKYQEYPNFDENNIKTYKYTFGQMAREIMEELEKAPWMTQ